MFPKIKGKLILAPMQGVTDVAFRMLCKELGAGICYTEFISADALIHYKLGNNIFDVIAEERPVVTQIFGEDKKKIFIAGEFLEGKTDVIDLNIGCPAPKVLALGGGAALLKSPKKVEEILEMLNTLKTPISCKIRLGIDDKHITAFEIAKIAEKTGCCAIAVHPRTQEQGYSGKADWDYIRKIKELVSIPVIGNGDVNSELDAERILNYTKCDYIMIGRAAMKDPFIFKKINYYFKTGKFLEDISFSEKIKLLEKYSTLAKKYNIYSDVRFKDLIIQFSKGYRNSTKLRMDLTKIKGSSEILIKVKEFELFCS